MNSIEPIQLQRLVDGELGFEETRRVLRLAERNPLHWRLIASTFVENQVWRAGFAEPSGSADQTTDIVRTEVHVSNRTLPRAARGRWMSLAASIVLAGLMGFLVGQRGWVPGFNPAQMAANRASADNMGEAENSLSTSADHSLLASNDTDANRAATTPAVYRMQLEDPEGNQFMDSDIPLYPVRQQNDLHRLRDEQIPESLRQQAHDSGYQIDQKIRYLSGRMNDGRQFVIPVRDYRLRPPQ